MAHIDSVKEFYTVVIISDYSTKIKIQLKNADKVISTQVTSESLGSNEFLLIPPSALPKSYVISVQPYFNYNSGVKTSLKSKIVKDYSELIQYQFLYSYSVSRYENKNYRPELRKFYTFFKLKPAYLNSYNEVSHKYAWLLYNLEEYNQLSHFFEKAKIKITRLALKRSFDWLEAQTLMSLNHFKKSNKLYEELLTELRSDEKLVDCWKINREEIRAEQGFVKALYSYTNKLNPLEGKKQIIEAYDGIKDKGDFQLKFRVLYLLSAYYTMNSEFLQAHATLRLAYENIIKSQSKVGLFLYYNQLASIYLLSNNVTKAQINFRHVINYFSPNIQPYVKASIYLNLANTYNELQDYIRADRYYNKSKTIYKKIGALSAFNQVVFYQGVVDRKKGEAQQAVFKHKSSISYFENKSKLFLIRSIVELGNDYLKLKKYLLAKNEAYKALILGSSNRQSYNSISQNDIDSFEISRFSIKSVDQFKALITLAKIALLEKNSYQINKLRRLIEDNLAVLTLDSDKLHYLNIKIDLLMVENKLDKVLEVADDALSLIEKIRSKLDVSDLALHWNNRAKVILNKYLNLLIAHKNYYKVFNILEKYYAINLREKRRNTRNDIIRQKSKEIQQALDHYVNLERETLLSHDNDVQNKADEAKEYFLALNENETQPLKQELTYLTIEKLQKKLRDGELFLRYYINETNAVVFVIDNKSFEVRQLPDENKLKNTVKTILNNIKSKRFNKLAEQDFLFNQILPHKKINSGLYHKIIIIPDGVLNLLPFASININPLAGNYTPLVNKINIERTYSASDYFAEIELPKNNKTISIFSNPIFLQNSQNTELMASIPKKNKLWEFISLPYTVQEAKAIEALFPNFEINNMSERLATNENLLSKKTRYSNIIHIATHGFFNDERLESVGVATTIINENNNKAPGILAMREILNQPFKANLAVVSGCETTLGKEINGEGFNSLSRGLLSQGVGSVIGTIWSISDRATPVFMKEFYSNLRQNNGNVSQALNKTQFNFATKSEFRRYRHPYYWAGFVLTSSNSGISSKIFD